MVAVAEAEAFKAQGNEHFRFQRVQQACASYRQALEVLRGEEAASAPGDGISQLGQAVRMNLATCLQRLGSEHAEVIQLCDEVIRLCDEVLASEPTNAKALFRRATTRKNLAGSLPESSAGRREALVLAMQDLAAAAKSDPADRQVSEKLEEVAAELRAMGVSADEAPGVEPQPQLVCSNCGRPGHARCGKQLWIEQRAAWLCIAAEEVDKEPGDFENDGTLMRAVRAARIAAAADDGDQARAAALSRYMDPDNEDSDDLPELSDSEREMIEDCLEAVERPYQRLKRSLRLAQAVRCAEELWEDD